MGIVNSRKDDENDENDRYKENQPDLQIRIEFFVFLRLNIQYGTTINAVGKKMGIFLSAFRAFFCSHHLSRYPSGTMVPDLLIKPIFCDDSF